MINDITNSFNDVYVLIPNANKEATSKPNKSHSATLNLTLNIPRKSLNRNDLKAVLSSKNYILKKSEDIMSEFLKLGNLMEKALHKIDFSTTLCYSKRYVKAIFQNNLDKIIYFKYKGETIKENTESLMSYYQCSIDDELKFYTFLYEIWEITYLKKYLEGLVVSLPILFEKFSVFKYDNEDITNRFHTFLTDYECYSSYKFHLLEDEDDNFKMYFATELIQMPLMFETMTNIACLPNHSKYGICENPNCRNLMLTQRNTRKYCDDCASYKVQKSQAKHQKLKI